MSVPPVPYVVCTFGHYNQSEPWSDVRTLTWYELAVLMTTHTVGAKEGTCIVPATFRGEWRKKDDAERIDIAFLDSDAGFTLDEIRHAIVEQGWAAIIATTHSHLTTCTRAKRASWDKFQLRATNPKRAPADFLIEKGFLPRTAESAVVLEAASEDELVIFEHKPCPKFRIAIPLLHPWLAANYDNQRIANAAWKERIEALAAVLGLQHDQSCTDTSRLFYLPRRSAGGPAPETAILEGVACDLFGLPAAPAAYRGNARSSSGTQLRGSKSSSDDLCFSEPVTGEIVDLRAWARCYAPRFEIVTALKARRPGVFTGKVVDQTKHHLRCANEDAHTQAGVDAATFVMNASEGSHGSFVCHCRHAHCDGRDRLLFLRQMLEQGWLTIADLTDPQFLSGEGRSRPIIHFVGGELPTVVDKAEQALLDAELGLYQRGSSIVRPGAVRVAIPKRGEVPVQQIVEVRDRALTEAMTRAAEWLKYDKRSRKWIAIDAPLQVAATYLQRVGSWRLPVLTAVINAPTLRSDGSVLAVPGYDDATGLLLYTGELAFPAIPDQPDWDEGRRALSVLMQLIETFPFIGEADRAVALSAILTACIRRSLTTAPLHGFSAPIMGSGKSKLVDIASLIVSGREAAVIAQGKTEEETEKRLGALLLNGASMIPVDNCDAPLGGEFLCQMLTQPIVRARILGRSEIPQLLTNATVTATGNNLTFVGDMTRRALLCRLDPQCERPELRTFSSDPLDVIKADRPRFLVAALTALRAFHVAGRPQQAKPLGSFGDWSRCVRDVLIWYGLSDPVETMEAVRSQDPQLDVLTAVLAQWWQVIGSGRVSSQDIIEHATQTKVPIGFSFNSRPEFVHPSFREVLLQVAGDGGLINSRRLSRWITRQENRIADGFRIVRIGLLRGFMTWGLEQIGTSRSEAT